MSEQIVTGKKYRILTDVAQKIWQRVSFWTKASDVEFNDGNDAESKIGAFKGITTSTNVETTGFAADATVTTELYRNLTASGAIKNYEVQEGDGVYITYQDGADTVRKKLGKFPIFFPKLEFCARNNDYSRITLNNLEDYEKVTIESITHSTNTGKTIKIYGVTDADGHELIFTETPPSDTNIELDIKQYKGIFLEFSGWSGETSLSQSFVTNIYIN